VARNDYHFVTRWLVDGTTDEVAEVFRDAASFVRWFPAVFLEAAILEPGDDGEVGKVVAVRVKGWMPHSLRFTYRVAAADYPRSFTLDVWGDFNGRLVCRAVPHGERLAIYFDWRVRVTKPFVQYLSLPLRRCFAGNHRWVVARGEESLNLELRRRRGETGETDVLPVPPEPTFPHGPVLAYLRSRVWSRATLLDADEVKV
jgi:hypothetical protein